MRVSTNAPSGAVSLKVMRGVPARVLSFWEIITFGLPFLGESREVNLYRLKNVFNLWRGFWKVMVARMLKIPHFYGQVSADVIGIRTNEQAL